MKPVTTTNLSLAIRKLHYLLNLGLRDFYVLVLQLGQEVFDVNSSFVKKNLNKFSLLS